MRGVFVVHFATPALTQTRSTRPRRPTPPNLKNISRSRGTRLAPMYKTSISANASSSGTNRDRQVSYFVGGAREIYEGLAALSVPGYVPYAAPAELADPKSSILHQIQRSLDTRTGVEMGTDPLAMARDNTFAVFNTTPVHARAGQFVLIRRWIALQGDLRDKFAAYPGSPASSRHESSPTSSASAIALSRVRSYPMPPRRWTG